MRWNDLLENKSLTRSEISKLIRNEVRKFGEDAWEINNGWCWGFANKLAKKLGPNAKVVNSTTDYTDGTFPGHSWVEFNGYHFDAESPFGEKEPKDMQYHKRLRAIADAPDHVSVEDAVRLSLGKDPVYPGKKIKVENLNEVFDGGFEYRWTVKQSNYWKAEFMVGEEKYIVTATIDDTGWVKNKEDTEYLLNCDLSFGIDRDYFLGTKVVGTGKQEFKIFATVITAFKEYLSYNKPDYVSINASKENENRIGLYKKMVTRMTPEIEKLGYKESQCLVYKHVDTTKYFDSICFQKKYLTSF